MKQLPTDVLLDLYQKMVVPVMLYGCEVWGHENIEVLEKLHVKSLKYILHLNRSTMSSHVFGESGYFPLLVDIKVRMVGFWADLVNPSCEKITNKIYEILHNLFCRGDYMSPWLLEIKQILVNAGLECVWNTQTFTSKASLCKLVRKSLKASIATQWREQLNNSPKCFFYKNYKAGIIREPFIKELPERFIISLVKFRCNNHKLPIEQGRKFGIPREERLCRKCDMGVVGDEFHLIMECSAHREARIKYIPHRFRQIRSTYNFCRLMSSKSKAVTIKLAKFLIETKSV